MLDRLIPVAKARDTKVYSFILENTHSGLTRLVPNWPKVLQVDARAAPTTTPASATPITSTGSSALSKTR